MPNSSWPRRLRVPLLAVAVPTSLWVLLRAMNRFQFALEHVMTVQTLFIFSVMLSVLTQAGWFLLSRWIPGRVKLAAVGLAVLCGAAVFWTVRTVEFDGEMAPHVRLRWEPTAEDKLAEFRKDATPAADAADLTVGPDDSPAFRGPAGDGVSSAKLADDWATPPRVVWRHPVGSGHAGVAVAGNSLLTLEQRGLEEAVVCYDRDTGRERWAFAQPAKFATSEPMGGDGPRTTPSVVDGLVYALGGAGDLVCLDGKTGAKKWGVNILADAGAVNLEWGMSGSPLVADGKVVVNPGVDPKSNQNRAVAAYDRYTGAKLWAAGGHPAGYASPLRADFNGVTQAVVFDAAGVGGYALADGKELWRQPWKTDMGMNSAQPVRVGPSRLFVGSELSLGGAVIDVAGSPTEVWKNRTLAARFTSPVFHDGHLYGLKAGRLVCVDAATGKKQWDDGNYGSGQLLLADGKLVITAEKGFIALVKADPAEYAELGRFAVFADRTWNVPALAGRRLYMRNHRELTCVELPGRN